MINISGAAKARIVDAMQVEEAQGKILRFSVVGRGPGGFRYALGFVPEEDCSPDDTMLDFEQFQVCIDANSAPKLEGVSIDYFEDEFRQGFNIENPNPLWSDQLSQSVQQIIDTKINPGIASHRGYVTLLEVKGDTAFIQFGGGCQGCSMVDVTLKQGVEVTIRENVPEIMQVLDTTDHAEGTNPYFQPGHRGQSPVS
jgi:Fe/S biogenesis protein NfuA